MLVRPGSPRVFARRAALGTLAVSLGVVGLPAAFASAAVPTTPFISEIHYDDSTSAGDTGEFVEVQFAPGADVTGWSVVLYNGSNGSVYDTDLLTSVSDQGVAVVDYDRNGVQNGSPDGVALVDPAGELVEFISYEGSFRGAAGPAAGVKSTDIIAAETSTTTPGHSLSRLYDASADESFWASPAPATKGQVNPAAAPVPDVCETPETHTISQVQGTGRSTEISSTVTVSGVVVGDLPSFGGFYLQDPAGDPTDGASDGIFVTSNKPVDLGDTVAVTGVPWEDFGQTEIPARRYVSICEEGDATDLPPAMPLDLPATDDQREPLEGMRVAPVDTLTVSEVFDLTSFGELTLSEDGVLVQPTELARPGPDAETIAVQNATRMVLLDDGLDSRTSATDRPYLSPETPVRVGDEVTLTGTPLVLGYGFGNWRLQPADGSAEGTIVGQNTRPEETLDEVGGDVQVGAFNVLNYFLTLSGPDARGARSPEAFEKQAAKIVTAIGALDADVVTLMEIEDTDSTGYSPGDADAALADLVDRLNSAAGAGTWSYVPLPKELYGVDRDVIRNGIIYRSDVVQAINRAGRPRRRVDLVQRP